MFVWLLPKTRYLSRRFYNRPFRQRFSCVNCVLNQIVSLFPISKLLFPAFEPLLPIYFIKTKTIAITTTNFSDQIILLKINEQIKSSLLVVQASIYKNFKSLCLWNC
jgi:hypothetical protein